MHDTLIISPPGDFIRCHVPLLHFSASACRTPALMYAPTAMHQLRRGQETAFNEAYGGAVNAALPDAADAIAPGPAGPAASPATMTMETARPARRFRGA